MLAQRHPEAEAGTGVVWTFISPIGTENGNW